MTKVPAQARQSAVTANLPAEHTRLEKHGINGDYYTTNMYFQGSKFSIKD